MQRVTYCWKTLDDGYNFALNFIAIGGLHTKLWAPKVAGVSVVGIPRQNAIWMWPLWKAVENTIKGKVVASQSSGRGESCES